MTDYRTTQTLEVIVNGEIKFRQTGPATDSMHNGTDVHYAKIYTRILNPDLPADVPATFEWSSRYGSTQQSGTIPALHPNHEYLIPWTHSQFADREWEH